MCVCSIRYPASNARAPHCHLWPVRLYNTFPCHLINGTVSEGKGKKSAKYKMGVSIFSTTFVWKIPHFKENCVRYDHKCMYVCMYVRMYYVCMYVLCTYVCVYIYIYILLKYLIFFSDINQTWIFWTDFPKSNTKFHENKSTGSRVLSCGRTDRRDEANSRFSQFRNVRKRQELKHTSLEGDQWQATTVLVLLCKTEEESVSTACSAISNPDKTP